jgi:hypothetical protein
VTNAPVGDVPPGAIVTVYPDSRESPTMVVLVALPLIALAALVVDTVRIADRIGGFPPVELTYRAYSV